MKHKGMRLTLIIIEAFVSLTSITCGIGLAVGVIQLPVAWLAGTLFRDYTAPGLIMSVIVGGSSFLAAELTYAGRAGGLVASVFAGLLLIGLEVAEVTMLDPNLGAWLPFALGFQAIYSALSLVIVGSAAFLWRTEYHHRRLQSKHVGQA